MSTLSSLTLENVRTFRNRTRFDLAPLTLLVGPNNAGKSTLHKVLLFLRHNAREGRLHRPTFEGGDHGLGSFASLRSRGGAASVTVGASFYWDTFDEYEFESIEGEDLHYDRNVHHVHFEATYSEHAGHTLLSAYRIALGDLDDPDPIVDVEVSFDVEHEGHTVPALYTVTVHGDQFLGGPEDALDTLGLLLEHGWSGDRDYDRLFRPLTFQYAPGFDYPWALFDRDPAGRESLSSPRIVEPRNAVEPMDAVLENAVRSAGDATGAIKGPSDRIGFWVIERFFRPYVRRWNRAIEGWLSRVTHVGPGSVTDDRFVPDSHPLAQIVRANAGVVGEGVARWAQSFGLADDVSIDRVADAGYTVSLVRGGEAYALADLGYGYARFVALLLALAAPPGLRGTGSGLRNVLVEEPEVHLHPNLQSRLADLFMEMTEPLGYDESLDPPYPYSGTSLLVETHSEYIVRRIQYLLAKRSYSEGHAVVYYLGPDPSADDYVRRIEVDSRGHLSGEFGSGFTDEATSLMMGIYRAGREN